MCWVGEWIDDRDAGPDEAGPEILGQQQLTSGVAGGVIAMASHVRI